MTPDEAILILKRDNPNNIAVRTGHEDLFDQRNEAFSMAIKALEQELKMGHWIGRDGHYICSCCKRDPLDFLEPCGLDGGSYMDTPMKYCPHCGAEMIEQ